MITRQQIDQLLAFQNGEYLVTSCYLNLDRRQMPAAMLKIKIKDLLQTAQQELAQKAATHRQRESLRHDFERIEAHVLPELASNRLKAVALFACSGEEFWQAFDLPRMGRNILIADRMPYVRPLTARLAEHRRYAVVTVDRSHGQIFELYAGAIRARADVTDAVPRRVREAGLGGRDERKMERHLDAAVQHHYQHLAGELSGLFHREHFDWLILGGQRDAIREFKTELPAVLQQRCVGEFHADPGKITLPEVLQQALAIERHVERAREEALAAELVTGRRAVKGVRDVLGALDRGEAQTLLVEDGFELPGYACVVCHFASLEPATCPYCGQPAAPCADVVEEAVELALHRNCHIEHLASHTPLHEVGRIGALLRYQAA